MQEIKRIPLEGVHNTRDLGGYLTMDGRRIKPYSLIRSGELFNLTQEDKEVLSEEYKLSTIIDFRTKMEREERPDPVLEGVNCIHNPILEESTFGITREGAGDTDITGMLLKQLADDSSAGIKYMEKMYQNLVTHEYCKSQYASFFNLLLNQTAGSVLWHCSAGKDRVGTGTALLLSILGIPREQIVADYLKVNEFAVDNTNHIVEKVFMKTGDKRLSQQVRTLLCVQESYIETIFRVIKEGYGSVEQYLKEEMGIGRDGISSLKRMYLLSNQ